LREVLDRPVGLLLHLVERAEDKAQANGILILLVEGSEKDEEFGCEFATLLIWRNEGLANELYNGRPLERISRTELSSAGSRRDPPDG
jgi:hypothetical protein